MEDYEIVAGSEVEVAEEYTEDETFTSSSLPSVEELPLSEEEEVLLSEIPEEVISEVVQGVEEGEEIEAEDDESAALYVANMSIAGGDEDQVEDLIESPQAVRTAESNAEFESAVLGYLQTIAARSDPDYSEELEEMSMQISTMNDNIATMASNIATLQKFNLGITCAILGALIVYFFFSKFR